MKVGDLVRMPRDMDYWWSEKVGIIISAEGQTPYSPPLYKVVVAPQSYLCFNDASWVEIVSESRRSSEN